MMTFYWVSLTIILLSMVGLLYRLYKGPSVPDRLIALDALGIMIISATALLAIIFETNFFIEVILLVAIISFIGTVAFSKFIQKGEIIEDDRNR